MDYVQNRGALQRRSWDLGLVVPRGGPHLARRAAPGLGLTDSISARFPGTMSDLGGAFRVLSFSGLILAVLTLGSGWALADVVVLTNGERIEGIVREQGNQVLVEMDVGTLTLSRDEVKAVQKRVSPIDELRKRQSKVDARNPKALYELAVWAKSQGLASQARALSRQVLRLEPEHVGAHVMVGHRFHDGTWMTEAAYMRATGHVRYGGRWVDAREAQRLEAEALALEQAQADKVRRARMEVAVARAEKAAAEAKAEAEAARRRAESLQVLPQQNAGYPGWWGSHPLVVRPNWVVPPRQPGTQARTRAQAQRRTSKPSKASQRSGATKQSAPPKTRTTQDQVR